jgi:hypothetical protein
VATLLADPPAGPSSQQAPPGSPGSSPEAPAASAPRRQCVRCGAPLAPAQDWCTSCGAGAPGSLGRSVPGWRAAAAVLAALAVLVAGAATAGYAALHKSSRRSSTSAARALAAVPAAPVTPAAPVPPVSTPKVPRIGPPTTIKPAIPLKAPKIPPLGAVAPKPIKPPAVTSPPSAVTSPRKATKGGGTTPTATTKKDGGNNNTPVPVSVSEQPSAMLLDTNAASTYNPSGQPAGNFGDPRLAIDGDTSTGWTARVDPAGAPKLAEGLLIDLNSPQRVSALRLVTSTPGMAVQVYAANGSSAPATITDPGWAALSRTLVAHKKRLRIGLSDASHSHRFVLLWISRAPSAASAHVSVNELELFPPK